MTYAQTLAPTFSPWGAPQHKEQIAPGIWSIETASHGGFWVSPERLEQMPIKETAYSKGGFFEEDCDWCLVVVAFPEAFDKDRQAVAKALHKHYFQ